MSFAKAKHCFEDNSNHLDSGRDTALWNLNAGLLNLTKALQSELSDLERKVQQLETQIRNV